MIALPMVISATGTSSLLSGRRALKFARAFLVDVTIDIPETLVWIFLHVDYLHTVKLHPCKMKSKRKEVSESFYFLCFNTVDHFLRRGQEKSSKWPVPI